MIRDIFENYGVYIYIAIAIIIFILIIIVEKKILNKKPVEAKSSILDVDIDGVVDKDFEYGYEKEDTVVMKPVEKNKKNTKKKNTKKKK